MNMQKLLQQAEEMQEKMQRDLAETVVEASAGGDLVSCKINGHKHLLSLRIDPEAIDPEDPSMLEDLVVAAINQAQRNLDEQMQSRMGSLASSLPGFL